MMSYAFSVMLKYPPVDVAVAEAFDNDLPPNNGIRYSIEKIEFTINGKTQNAPTAFTINANDGTIVIGTNDYSDYVGGYFSILVIAEDRGAAHMFDSQTHLVSIYRCVLCLVKKSLFFVFECWQFQVLLHEWK